MRRLNPFRRGGGDSPKGRKPWRPLWTGAVFGALALAVILFAGIFQWNWLRGPIGRFASARIGRQVELLGDLKVHLWSWTPSAEIGGVTIGEPGWAGPGHMAEIGQVRVSIRLLPLLHGQVILPLLSIQRPNVTLLRDGQGRANWDFSNGKRKTPGKPFQLPPIQTFVIADGKLTARDVPRKLSFAGTVNANEQQSQAYDHGFRLTGRGELNRNPFQVNVIGGPLLNVQPDRPYPFDATITAGATRVTAKGQVPKPFNLGVLDATVTVSGHDLNQLYDLTGLALPNTPPYSVTGRLRRDGQTYTYERFTGRVGASDINGDASVDLATGRPFVKARLNSRLLDFADLASLFGAPGASKAAAPEQKAEAHARVATGRLLPDATLQAERIRSMDAEVSYTADQVRAAKLPLRTVSVGMKLDHGLLTIDPISMRFPTGKLGGTASIDARPRVPVSKVDLRLSDIRLEQFIHPVNGSTVLSGTLLARARLTGAGDSVHRAAAASSGAVTVVIPHGQIRQAFAELMGIDATKGLFMLLAKDQTPTDVRCAVADFTVSGGVMTARDIVFDTEVVRVNGAGTVNLGDERLNLTFKGQPKKLRLVRVIAPITLQGHLADPKFGVEAGPAVAQAGVGVALGALLTPLAVILPFVSPGLEKDADCAGLFSEARQGAASVPAPKTARPPSAAKSAAKPSKAG